MPVNVERSGDLYLIARGDRGILVDVASGWVGVPATVDSILAHCNAYDPWVSVDLARCPAPVRDAAARLAR